MTFSLCVSHAPWVPERVKSLRRMLEHLSPRSRAIPFFLNDRDHRPMPWGIAKVAWALDQWRWSTEQTTVSHHVFMTDDLNIAPLFWASLDAMCEAHPRTPIGLLANHPRGPALAARGCRGYRTNSWIVGPAYVLPHALLKEFLFWYEHLEQAERRRFDDDSAINEWVTRCGPAETWHPLPTIIEHRGDLLSTVGHNDRFARERLSWREERTVVELPDGSFGWSNAPRFTATFGDMIRPAFWSGQAPLLGVGG